MNFTDCVLECCQTPELIKEFNRLAGRHVLEDKRAPIERMIDQASGYQAVIEEKQYDDMQAFISFVFEYIWMPVLKQEMVL